MTHNPKLFLYTVNTNEASKPRKPKYTQLKEENVANLAPRIFKYDITIGRVINSKDVHLLVTHTVMGNRDMIVE